MADSLITDEARAWIGRELSVETVTVTAPEIWRYCVGTGDLNPLYHDAEAAARGPHGGIVAPPMFAMNATRRIVPEAALQADGQYAEAFAAPVRATRTLAGGVETRFGVPVRPGDTITARSKIVDLYEKVGRSGPLVFQITETTVTNQRDEVVLVSRGTLIIR
jgi:acyl dehydratase